MTDEQSKGHGTTFFMAFLGGLLGTLVVGVLFCLFSLAVYPIDRYTLEGNLRSVNVQGSKLKETYVETDSGTRLYFSWDSYPAAGRVRVTVHRKSGAVMEIKRIESNKK